MATFEIIGLYEVVVNDETVAEATKFHKCDDDWLDENGKYAIPIKFDDVRGLGLIEARITGDCKPGSYLLSIEQDDQVPYMEFYLDDTGVELLSEENAANVDSRRVCFFLHFVDTKKMLKVGKGKMGLPEFSELPERLKPYTHYLPVD